MRVFSLLPGLLLLSSVQGRRRRYDGYQVWKVGFANHTQNALLEAWKSEGLIDQVGDEVMVSPEALPQISTRFQEHHIHHSIETVDIQPEVDALWSNVDEHTQQHHYDKDNFNTYEEISEELHRLQKENCPAAFVCTIYSIGKTYEGRDLTVFKISQGSGRQALWFDSMIHAREWLAGATLMRILDQFLTTYDEDDDTKYVLDNYDIYFLPVQNPDGYAYTWSDERFWRRNRRPNKDSNCLGVDLNRNFNWKWSEPGASNYTCSQNYYGPSAASENETQAVQSEVLKNLDKLVVFTSIHTAIPAWLTSYGDCITPSNNDDVMRVSKAAVAAIQATHGTVWKLVGNSCQELYATSGTSIDWAKRVGIPYTWTPELRGPGFDPQPSVIPLASQEMWNGFIAMVKEVDQIRKEK